MDKKTVAKKKETTSADFTPDSLNAIAEEITDIAKEVESAAIIMAADPAVQLVNVRYEKNRTIALKTLRNWISGAKAAIFQAKLEMAQNGKNRGSVRTSKASKKPDTK